MSQNGTISAKLNRNERRAIGALLGTTSIQAAAERAGLNRRTIHRYLDSDIFRAELQRQEGRIIDAGTRWLALELENSIGTLVELRDDKEISPAARIRAAIAIIGAMRELRTIRDIEQRLTRLEELIFYARN